MSTFTCPMHPEVRTNSPTRCPKCGTKLEPGEADRTTTKAKSKPTPVGEG